MPTKKLTIISIFYPPERGAAASRISNLATGLRHRGYNVEVITAMPNYPTGKIFKHYQGKLSQSALLDGISVRRYWLYASNSTEPVKRALNMISFSAMLFLALPHLIRTRPNAILVNTPPLTVGLSGVILGRICRIPTITNVSDIWPMSALELGAIGKGRLYFFLERLESYIYRYSGAIMAQSGETRQHILERYPTKKTFLYRNLEKNSIFPKTFPSITDRSPKLLYAGLLGVAQGVYDLCRHVDFREIGVEFHIYGDGSERAEIKQYVSDHPKSNIFLHDAVAKKELQEILSDFHATVIPLATNIFGAFPSKIYMAISAALPIIFSGSGEGARFIEHHGIGWVTGPRNYQGLSELAKNLTKMTDADYFAFRSRIRSIALENFDFDDQLDRLVEFIN